MEASPACFEEAFIGNGRNIVYITKIQGGQGSMNFINFIGCCSKIAQKKSKIVFLKIVKIPPIDLESLQGAFF